MNSKYSGPIVVGGIGGSGTRLIAKILNQLGIFIGNDLNQANDNLSFTLLFKRLEILSISESEFDLLVKIFVESMIGNGVHSNEHIEIIKALSSKDRLQHSQHWLQERASHILSNNKVDTNINTWGWKEPNTHILIERLSRRFKRLKYIHVIRNGLDMAFSKNQNQLKLWGPHFLNQEIEMSPYFSLKYWCVIHKRIIKIAKPLGNNFLLLNYDDFCLNPVEGTHNLLNFLEVDIEKSYVDNIKNLVKTPKSLGRFKQYETSMFDTKDIQYVASLGFDIS